MPVHSPRVYFGLVLVALIALFNASNAFAESPGVTAVLNNSEAQVGETVQLQIRVTAGRDAQPPEEISVNGLQIHYTGESSESQITFGAGGMHTISSVTFTYTILPLNPGTFKIPPQNIEVGGKSLRTPELTLRVSDNTGGNVSRQPSSGARRQPVDIRRYGFLELVVPKRDAYVGEMIPVEIKLGLNAQVRFQNIDFPDFNVQGVTLQKAQRPEESLETINGVTYRTWTLKAALAAIRPGQLEIPQIECDQTALVPRSRPRSTPRPRSSFDPFGMEDPFDDPFFNDPFGMLRGEPAKIPIKSEALALEIKPLPPNPPANFSGAVGTFTMNVEAKPKTVQIGDPITITAAVSGRGNFDRMTAPGLEDERGWHMYPPSGKFAKNDDVGMSGTKTFETVISPNERKPSIPPLSFSYFDPLKEQYLTLRSESVPIQVQGNPVANPQTAVAAATPAPQPGATSKPEDILYQLTDRGRIQSFAPIYTRPVFWLAQLVPLAGLLGLAGFKIREAKLDNREAQRVAALQHESAELLRTLRRKDLSPQEYFGQASRAVQLKTALAKNVDPNTVDAETAAHAFSLDEGSRQQLLQLFARSDELRYSGATNGEETISREARRNVLELIESLR